MQFGIKEEGVKQNSGTVFQCAEIKSRADSCTKGDEVMRKAQSGMFRWVMMQCSHELAELAQHMKSLGTADLTYLCASMEDLLLETTMAERKTLLSIASWDQLSPHLGVRVEVRQELIIFTSPEQQSAMDHETGCPGTALWIPGI